MELAFVVAHGFTGSSSGTVARGMARVLARAAGVVAFDFRGHGGQAASAPSGDLEVLDLAAAAGWARLLGYRRIVPVGFSLGAGVAVRYAALVAGTPDAVDAVVAVSAPSRWHYRGTRPMRLLHRGIETPIGRRVLAAGYAHEGRRPGAGTRGPSRRTPSRAGWRPRPCWWCTGTPTDTSPSTTRAGSSRRLGGRSSSGWRAASVTPRRPPRRSWSSAWRHGSCTRRSCTRLAAPRPPRADPSVIAR